MLYQCGIELHIVSDSKPSDFKTIGYFYFCLTMVRYDSNQAAQILKQSFIFKILKSYLNHPIKIK
jgi:hypothetical protein